MKKIIVLLLALVFCLAGCGQPTADVAQNNASGNTTTSLVADGNLENENLNWYETEGDLLDYQYDNSYYNTSSLIGAPTNSGTLSSILTYPTVNDHIVGGGTVSYPNITNSTVNTPVVSGFVSSSLIVGNQTTTSRPANSSTVVSNTTTTSRPTSSSSAVSSSIASSKPTITSTPTSSGTSSVTPTYLYVSYIDVGQGDSALIKIGNCDILIDGGTSAYGDTVSTYLKNAGVDDIELMINTHPDSDHYGGLIEVLNDYKVEKFWGSSYSKTATLYTTFKTAIRNEGLSFTTPSVGATYTNGNLTLTVLYNGAGASNSNDSSLVIMAKYGNYKFLFTGDISSSIESKLVSSGKSLSCNVLKVPHHGSAGSSSASFLNKTNATYGVICVGANNSYGHPTSAALSRLSSAGISVYRTDKNGNVVFSTNGTSSLTKTGSITSSASASSSSSSSSSSSDTFIGNKESKVFHLPTCPNLPAASKRNYLYNYWFIVNCIGYTPCQRCLKNYTP